MHSIEHRLHDDNQSQDAERLNTTDFGKNKRKPWVDPTASRTSTKNKRKDTFEERQTALMLKNAEDFSNDNVDFVKQTD